LSGNVTVTDVKVKNLRTVKHVGELESAWSPGRNMSFEIGGGSFTEVHTDAGITGIGPGMHPMLLDSVKEYLVGKSAFEIEQHAVAMNYYVQYLKYQGIAGVDMALWDIMGKAANLPLYKLWGGVKDKVILYASMVILSTPEERAEMALSLREEGWQAMKIRLHHETIAEDIRTIEAVRGAIGDDMTIMVDGNQAQSSGDWQPGVRWNFQRAYETAVELQDMNVYWLEEPLNRYDFDGLAELNSRVEMPIAGGENNPGLKEFRPDMRAGRVRATPAREHGDEWDDQPSQSGGSCRTLWQANRPASRRREYRRHRTHAPRFLVATRTVHGTAERSTNRSLQEQIFNHGERT